MSLCVGVLLEVVYIVVGLDVHYAITYFGAYFRHLDFVVEYINTYVCTINDYTAAVVRAGHTMIAEKTMWESQ